jgi:hypothetical protein
VLAELVLADLVVQVAVRDMRLSRRDTQAELRGQTLDGVAIRGVDSVVVNWGARAAAPLTAPRAAARAATPDSRQQPR